MVRMIPRSSSSGSAERERQTASHHDHPATHLLFRSLDFVDTSLPFEACRETRYRRLLFSAGHSSISALRPSS